MHESLLFNTTTLECTWSAETDPVQVVPLKHPHRLLYKARRFIGNCHFLRSCSVVALRSLHGISLANNPTLLYTHTHTTPPPPTHTHTHAHTTPHTCTQPHTHAHTHKTTTHTHTHIYTHTNYNTHTHTRTRTHTLSLLVGCQPEAHQGSHQQQWLHR